MGEEEKLIEKAKNFLADAKTGLEEMTLETVQNRIYYSMFNAAKAALLRKGFEPGTHEGVNRLIGRELVKKDLIPAEMGQFFSQQQTYREQADYEPETRFEREEIKRSIQKAEEFIQQMKQIMEDEN